MFCEMEPTIETSVRELNEDCWVLGTQFICERDGTSSYPSVVSWTDDTESTFRLHKIPQSSDQPYFLESVDATHSEDHRVHFAGTSSAIWKLGNVYCKVKSWIPTMPSEADTIRFVQSKDTTIPLPEVLHTWVDKSINRSFLLLKEVEGQTLAQAWPSLSPNQRVIIASTIAHFCKSLARNSSIWMQSALGTAINEPFLNRRPPADHPSWMPYLLPASSSTGLFVRLFRKSGARAPSIPDFFYFYHSDLGPGNIMIADDGSGTVTGVLDWESAAYYPSAYIGTKPLISAGFLLPPGSENRMEWAQMLVRALKGEGFGAAMDWYGEWKAAVKDGEKEGSSVEDDVEIGEEEVDMKIEEVESKEDEVSIAEEEVGDTGSV